VSSFSGAGDAFASAFLYALHTSSAGLSMKLRFSLEYTIKSLQNMHSNILPDNIINNVDCLIFQDSLTRLYNRRFFDEERSHIELSLRRRSNDSIAVAIFDIDNFKKVNDTYGHDTGDLVIKNLASVIKNNIRDNDVAIRFGGEEFVIIFHNADEQTAFSIADRIRIRFSEREITKDGNTLRNTTSGGIAVYDRRFNGLEEAVAAADKALYNSKHNGKNRITTYTDGTADL
jgi:diguanylate cyclase (GGDEF)-like protein